MSRLNLNSREVGEFLSTLRRDGEDLFGFPVRDVVPEGLSEILIDTPGSASSYWIVAIHSGNAPRDLKAASSLLLWKHLFAKKSASVCCIQSNDEKGCASLRHCFGRFDFPSLFIGSSPDMTEFIQLGPSLLETLTKKNGMIEHLFSDVHHRLASGDDLRNILHLLASESFWCDRRLKMGGVGRVRNDLKSSWDSNLSCGKRAGPAIRTPSWRVGDYAELYKFVDHSAEVVDTFVNLSRRTLGGGFGALREWSYASDQLIAGAIYDTIRARTTLVYDHEPSTSADGEQVVRLAGEVVRSNAATCLDLALLFSAVIEKSGSAPAIVIVRNKMQLHALGGFFVDNSEQEVPHLVTDVALIRELVNNKVAVVETTCLAAVKGVKRHFHEACEMAKGFVSAHEPVALINVRAARRECVKPL